MWGSKSIRRTRKLRNPTASSAATVSPGQMGLSTHRMRGLPAGHPRQKRLQRDLGRFVHICVQIEEAHHQVWMGSGKLGNRLCDGSAYQFHFWDVHEKSVAVIFA